MRYVVHPEQALEQYIQATNSHEFDNVAKMLHPHAVYWFGDKECKTIDEIRHYFENAWRMIHEEKYSASHVQWLVNTSDAATCIYYYHYEGYANGKFVQGSGRATNVFLKDEQGNWKLVHEHLSGLPAHRDTLSIVTTFPL